MAVTKIKVPKTPKRAFNSDRPASDLLKNQVKHLEWAIRPAAYRKPGKLRIKQVRTEGEAAIRIERLTRELLAQQNALPPPATTAKPEEPAAAAVRKPRTRKRKAGSAKASRAKRRRGPRR